MSTPQLNYTLLRLTLETIPEFNGDPDLLEIFISACDSFHTKYYSRTDTEINQFLYQAILGKLKGNPLLIIGSRTELDTWPLIKDELRNIYGERLSLDNLEQALMTCYLQKGESYHNYAKRLQILRSKLFQKLKTIPTTTMDAATKLIHQKQYNNLALKIFVRHLDRRLRDKIVNKGPRDLEQAMAFVQEDENFERFLQPQEYKNLVPKLNSALRQNTQSNNYSRQIQSHNQFPAPMSQSNSFMQTVQNPYNYQMSQTQFSAPVKQFNPFNNQMPQNQFSVRSNNQMPQTQFSAPVKQFNPFSNQVPQNQFSAPPNNEMPQFVNRTHYPTNSQVFGKPVNVWQPNPKYSQNLPKPTPMSGISTIPPIATNIPRNQNPNPTLMSTSSRDKKGGKPFHYLETDSSDPCYEQADASFSDYSSEHEFYKESEYGAGADYADMLVADNLEESDFPQTAYHTEIR